MVYDVIIVGGGVAGLTSAAYLSKSGHKVLLCEKENDVGGLVGSFEYNGFTLDRGGRALDKNSVFPLLNDLGIEMEFVGNKVSIGIEDEIIRPKSIWDLGEYGEILKKKFKDNIEDIDNIVLHIEKIIKDMRFLCEIDSSIFLDFKRDKKYIIKKVIPWSLKYFNTVRKIKKINRPIYDYLDKFTNNKAIIDMIAQNAFKRTSVFYTLGYYTVIFNYIYPKGGDLSFSKTLKKYILEHNGEVKTNVEIVNLNPERKVVKDLQGNEYKYKKVIWASDLKRLYSVTDINSIPSKICRESVNKKKNQLDLKVGGESLLTLYLMVDLDKSYFEKRCTGHFFYTPTNKGINSIKINEVGNVLYEFLSNSSYEISIPVLRDETLAPKGKTALIISTLMDYKMVKSINEDGWYEKFKKLTGDTIINVLNESVFKGIKCKVIDSFVTTPLTIERMIGSSESSIRGWAFSYDELPVTTNFSSVKKSVKTKIPDVYKAGQWCFSPGGVSSAILTGKVAAKKVSKEISNLERA